MSIQVRVRFGAFINLPADRTSAGTHPNDYHFVQSLSALCVQFILFLPSFRTLSFFFFFFLLTFINDRTTVTVKFHCVFTRTQYSRTRKKKLNFFFFFFLKRIQFANSWNRLKRFAKR